jgi:hypothetical protein
MYNTVLSWWRQGEDRGIGGQKGEKKKRQEAEVNGEGVSDGG